MTDSVRSGGPSGPPWSVDLLADLHAGVLDSETSARLWPQVNADPEARAMIEALDIIKVELGQLGNAPVEPMPAHFAARLDAALASEARRTIAPPAPAPLPPPVAPVVDLAAARRRRNRTMAWGVGILATAAAAVAVVVAVFPGSDKTGGSAVAGSDKPPAASNGARPPLAVESGNLSAAIGGVTNEKDYGALKDQEHLDACIRANDIDPSKVQTIGVRQVMLDGKPGILALLTTGEKGQFRMLVVEPTCGPGNPGKMANVVLPRG